MPPGVDAETFFFFCHLGEEELEVTEQDLKSSTGNYFHHTSSGLHFYANVKKSNEVIKLRPARKASA